MLAALFAKEIELLLKEAIRPAAQYLRMVTLGISYLLLAAISAGATLILATFGVYLLLERVMTPTAAIFSITGIWLFFTLLFAYQALRRVRPPR